MIPVISRSTTVPVLPGMKGKRVRIEHHVLLRNGFPCRGICHTSVQQCPEFLEATLNADRREDQEGTEPLHPGHQSTSCGRPARHDDERPRCSVERLGADLETHIPVEHIPHLLAIAVEMRTG